ncbi:hypothetical protein HA402_013567 [Bradysia odoriphaga]|nr:hypothetical protein HA402_013567 [Bradysia odoriphaga]
MKPTKSRTKVKSDQQSSSTIQKFFKAAPKESDERASSNVKSIYVNALLEKLNRFNEETDSSNKNNSAPNPTDDPNPTADPNSTTDLNPTTVPVKVNKSNRCGACGRSDKSNGCGGCDQWRSKYEEQSKCRIKLSLKYTDLMLKYDELVKVAKGMMRPSKNVEELLNEASLAILDSEEESQAISASDRASQAIPASDGASQAMSAPDGSFQAMSTSDGASQAMSAPD